MKTRRIFALLLAIALTLSLAHTARADLPDMPDPVHVKFNKTDPPPMDDMRTLAKGGDTRAMFILGDMYEKQKGGLKKDWTKARKWFQNAAIHGMNYAFIRLAAMAKHDKHPQEAWQWYTLAVQGFNEQNSPDSAATLRYVITARKALVKTAKLSYQDLNASRAQMNAWQNMRDQKLSGENTSQHTASIQAGEFKLNQ